MKWLGDSTAKVFSAGTVRARAPQETWDDVVPLFPEVGLSRVGLVTGLDCVGIPTAMAIRPNSRSLSVSQGKGVSWLLARLSAALESLELHHAEDVRLPLRRATLFDLMQEGALMDVGRLPGAFCAPYPELRTLWVEGFELLSQRALWVPLGLVHMDLTLPLLEGSEVFPPSSNGLAAGNTRSEALLHGLCELIERDAYTRFFQSPAEQQFARRVDLSTVRDAGCQRLIDRFFAAGLLLEVWDITSDIEVPCYLCAALEASESPFRTVGIAYGAGAHLQPGVALSRALTEVAQSRLTRITGSRDDMQPESMAHLRRAGGRLSQIQQFSALPGAMPFRAKGAHDGTTFEQDVHYVLAQLAKAQISQVIAVDLSRRSWPIAVVRVIVAGLEGLLDSPAYRPGPRALGRSR